MKPRPPFFPGRISIYDTDPMGDNEHSTSGYCLNDTTRRPDTSVDRKLPIIVLAGL